MEWGPGGVNGNPGLRVTAVIGYRLQDGIAGTAAHGGKTKRAKKKAPHKAGPFRSGCRGWT